MHTDDNDTPRLMIHRGTQPDDLTMHAHPPQIGVPGRFAWRPAPDLPHAFGVDQIPGGKLRPADSPHPAISGIAVPTHIAQYDRPSRRHGYGRGVEHPQGRRWLVTLRPATIEEAAPVLAAEATRHIPDTREAWERLGVEDPAAITTLIEAGWTPRELAREHGIRVVDEADARVVATHLDPRGRRPQAGWYVVPQEAIPVTERWRASQALSLLEGGIDLSRAQLLRQIGYTSVDEALAARAPQVEPGATRVRLDPGHPHVQPVWAGSAEHMQHYLHERVLGWTWDLHTETGPRVVHVGRAHLSPSWMLWDDGQITTGRWHSTYSRPQTLSTAAAKALELVVQGGRTDERDLWDPMLQAHNHSWSRDQIGQDRDQGWWYTSHLEEHVFDLGTETVTWWKIEHSTSTPTGYGDGSEPAMSLHTSRAEAVEAAHRYRRAQIDQRPTGGVVWADPVLTTIADGAIVLGNMQARAR